MELLSEPNWRGGDTPKDLWMESFLRASGDHRRMIHNIMKKHGLTTREAVKKLYKCDEKSALHDYYPLRVEYARYTAIKTARSTSYYRKGIGGPHRCDAHRTRSFGYCYSYTRTSGEISRINERYTGWG